MAWPRTWRLPFVEANSTSLLISLVIPSLLPPSVSASETFCLISQHLTALIFDVAFAGVEWRNQPKLNSRTLDSPPNPLLQQSARSVEL